jgi:hypothetical protein
MRTPACVVFVLYLGLTGTAVARGGGAGTGTGLSSLTFAIFPPQFAISPPHQDHHRHAQHPERKIVIHHVAKANHHHLRPSGYAEELTSRHNVSFGTSITQLLINKTHTLAPGTPLLGLDPRSPSTWLFYSEMLPFIFSETPGEAGM